MEREEIIAGYRRAIRRQRRCGLAALLAFVAIIILAVVRVRLDATVNLFWIGALAALVGVIIFGIIGNFIFYRCPACKAFLSFDRGRSALSTEIERCGRCGVRFR